MKTNSSHSAPKWLLNLFRWYCKPEYHDDIEGDLLELFAKRVRTKSSRSAKLLMLLDVLQLFRPGIIRPLFIYNQPFIHPAMIKHNLLISYRSFLRDKSTFFIHVIGLSTGLACVLLIYLWVNDELQMDAFHENGNQLYQVLQVYNTPDGVEVVDWTPGPLATTLKEEIPQVRYATSVKTHEIFRGVLSYEGQHVKALPIFVESDFHEMFSFPLLFGRNFDTTSDKYGIIISESIAAKLFSSSEKAIGKSIEGENFDVMGGLFTVQGVFKDFPKNSTVQFDVILSYDFFAENNPNIHLWTNDQASTYVLLNERSHPEDIAGKVSGLVASKREIEGAQFLLQKYSNRYLFNKFEEGKEAGGRIDYVWLFSAIALLVLIIACINFMNLSTARSGIRMKEIGVKKTMGASRLKLIFQFITESLLLSFISLIIAYLLIWIALPQFNFITGKQLDFPTNLKLIFSFLGISVLVGLLASSYPALYLSGFKPTMVLKGKLETNLGGTWIRKSLVIFQFTVTIIFIVAVLVIHQQMSFIQEKNLGYDRENIVSIQKEAYLKDKLESFLAEVRKLPEVVYATNSNTSFLNVTNFTGGIDWDGREENENFRINVFNVNYDYIKTLGIHLKEGRSFTKEFGADTATVILNQAAVDKMRLQDPIGETITFWGNQVKIIGVTENFHFQSLYQDINPCIFSLFAPSKNFGDKIWLKINAGSEKTALSGIEEIYEQFNPGIPFEFSFVDEEYDKVYKSEARVAVLSQYFSALAIIISCLGLLGLAAFTTQRRQKEIGVRKVLGAKVFQLVQLLSADFTRLVFIAIITGLPIGYIITQKWLGSFAYKIEPQWWHFAGTAGIILLISWLTVGAQTLKTATANPLNSLKEE